MLFLKRKWSRYMSGGLIWLAFTYVLSRSTLNIGIDSLGPLGFETIPNASLTHKLWTKPHHVEKVWHCMITSIFANSKKNMKIKGLIWVHEDPQIASWSYLREQICSLGTSKNRFIIWNAHTAIAFFFNMEITITTQNSPNCT